MYNQLIRSKQEKGEDVAVGSLNLCDLKVHCGEVQVDFSLGEDRLHFKMDHVRTQECIHVSNFQILNSRADASYPLLSLDRLDLAYNEQEIKFLFGSLQVRFEAGNDFVYSTL